MPTMTPASSRPSGRRRSRRHPAALLAAVVLLIGAAAACEPPPPDTDPPSWAEAHIRLATGAALGPHLTLAWPAASGATRYRIDANGTTATMLTTGTTTTCALVGLAAATAYDIEITAYDAAGNWSGTLPNLRHRPGRLGLDHTTPAGASGGPSLRCVPTTDTDGDRLPNTLETGTGTYSHTAATGSSPTLPDSDEDGMGDGEEVVGTAGGLDLLALGARPQQRDLIVEVDWLTDITAPGRTPCPSVPNLQPTAARVQTAIDTYAEFPLDTPLGGEGINLIVDRGQGGAFTGGNAVPDADGRLDSITAKAAHMATNRVGYVHYAINVIDFYILFAGYRTGGLAPKPGDRVSIGHGCGTGTSDWNLNAVLAHELGHNANLDHGGHDAENGKPQYNSLMNYTFAYGIDIDCDGDADRGAGVRKLAFSSVVQRSINESVVHEVYGVCGNGTPADLDRDGIIDTAPYALDLSGDGDLTVLEGSDDTEHLDLALSFPRNRSGGPDGAEIHDPLP